MRDRQHREALLPLDDDESLRGEARQRLAHGIDADVIGTAQRLQLELGAGLQYAQNDVAAQAVLQRLGQGRMGGDRGVHVHKHSRRRAPMAVRPSKLGDYHLLHKLTVSTIDLQKSRRFFECSDGRSRRSAWAARSKAKLAAAAKAGFRAVEIFENDLTFFSGKPRDARDDGRRSRARDRRVAADARFRGDAGRDPRAQFRARRAQVRADARTRRARSCACAPMSRTRRSTIRARAAADLAELADRARRHGFAIGYEALAWGRHVKDWTAGLGSSCAPPTGPISASCSTVSTPACAAIRSRR